MLTYFRRHHAAHEDRQASSLAVSAAKSWRVDSKVSAATIFAIAKPGAVLCCRAETLQGTIGLSCRAMFWSDSNAKGTAALPPPDAEFPVHPTSPKGWPTALLKFNHAGLRQRASALGTIPNHLGAIYQRCLSRTTAAIAVVTPALLSLPFVIRAASRRRAPDKGRPPN